MRKEVLLLKFLDHLDFLDFQTLGLFLDTSTRVETEDLSKDWFMILSKISLDLHWFL